MYKVKMPKILKWPYPSLVWNVPNQTKTLYLTFDDGPIPGVTNWVLDLLKDHQIKATFFIVGENALKNNNLLKRTLAEGHAVGNHTFNHLNGWKTKDKIYLENIEKGQAVHKSHLFRPPYGRIKQSQISALSPDYKIIMWDVLSGDFDNTLSAEKCAQNVIKHLSAGSIIVFHDSVKAWPRLKTALPQVLKAALEQGYNFKPLT